MRIDNVTTSILNHLTQKEELDFSRFSGFEKKKCFQVIDSLGYSIEEFQTITHFDTKEISLVIYNLVKLGNNIHHLFAYLNWKNFEDLIAIIFDKAGHTVIENFRFKDEYTRFEIDVLSYKYPYIFAIDCKYHKNRASSPLKKAAIVQMNRVESLIEAFPVISESVIKQLHLPIKRLIFVVPLIISWGDHNVHLVEGIPIVSFNRLSGFLQDLDEFRDDILSFELSLS
ncbi:MAG: hypothetical protein KAS95_05730 [Candidatus Heimdallarchaeota archaeon]|nr:hypothetical protein [Candidatus Heimdallarchaeota archaeon]